MSNLTTFKDNLPAHLQNVKLDDFTKAFTASGGSNKRISLRGRVFRLVDGGKEIAKNTDPHLDVVIVNGSKSVQKKFYANAYDPDEVGPADCWSSTGERPDADVADPQASHCKECPRAIKGSASSNKTQCKFSWNLAVVLKNNIAGDIYQLVLPSKSIFGTGDVDHMPFLQYAKYVAQSGYNLNMLATRLTFDTDSDYPKLLFSNIEFLDSDSYDVAIQQGESQLAINASRLSFGKKPEKELPKMIAPEGSAAAALTAPAKRVDTKKADTVKPNKAGLSAMVDDWGDDK